MKKMKLMLATACLVAVSVVANAQAVKIPADIQKLLEKNTCLACHHPTNRLVGPPYKDVAKRKYTPERIADLVAKPNPANWPDYPAPMAALPNVPREDAIKIGKWINSLAKKKVISKKTKKKV